MEIGPIRGLGMPGLPGAGGAAPPPGKGCAGIHSGRRMHGMFKMPDQVEEAEADDSVEEFDELDTNQDGVVDNEELKAAGVTQSGGFQSTQDFLSLLGVKVAESS